MPRELPVVPNPNTRVPILHLIPLLQEVTHIPAKGLDEWGNKIYDYDNAKLYKCKVKYGVNRLFYRDVQGFENVKNTYIYIHGKLKVDTDDMFRYQFPDGDIKDFNVDTIDYTFDMQGNVFMTKVWCK